MLATRAAITLAAARLRLARPHSRAAATRPLAASSSAMAAATPKLKLTYFNIKARAEPTRLALFIGGIPFEDIRLSHGEEWPAHKGEMPYGQVPVRVGSKHCAAGAPPHPQHTPCAGRCGRFSACARARLCAAGVHACAGLTTCATTLGRQVLEVDGKILAQSYAILMYAGRLSGLVPSDSFQAAKARAPTGGWLRVRPLWGLR